ncbi:PQQ-binding-like beta-propeller repeat protein [Streptomyces sirii]|uniref:PQQ-binding-like beta-propeller repeat protein n=1 Tax=Streptomyces sirii TaxID=3127701 RepID=A0ABZ2QZN1_9ACTN
MHALNAVTGAVRWTAPAFSTKSYESPVIAADADSVYLTWSEDLDLDHQLTTVQAYDARTGRPRWRAERTESSYSAVTAPGHHLIVGYLDDWYGYDTRSGRARWRVSSGEDGTASTPPLVADGVVYRANEEGVRAIRLSQRPEEL